MQPSNSLWFGLGLDLIESNLYLISIGRERDEVRSRTLARAESYWLILIINLSDGIPKLYDWLRNHGIAEDKALRMIEQFKASVQKKLAANHNAAPPPRSTTSPAQKDPAG